MSATRRRLFRVKGTNVKKCRDASKRISQKISPNSIDIKNHRAAKHRGRSLILCMVCASAALSTVVNRRMAAPLVQGNPT